MRQRVEMRCRGICVLMQSGSFTGVRPHQLVLNLLQELVMLLAGVHGPTVCMIHIWWCTLPKHHTSQVGPTYVGMSFYANEGIPEQSCDCRQAEGLWQQLKSKL